MWRRSILKFWQQLTNKISINVGVLSKRVRNRVPEKLVDFSSRRLLPYLPIVIITLFTMTANFARAADNSSAYAYSDQMMDLSAADIAQVASVVGPYTSNVEVDPVSVALAMQDTSYLDKPVVAETKVTVDTPVATTRKSTITYIVEGGDTLSSIGWKYGLKISTIKATNSLTSDLVRPGQQLRLPPQDLSPTQLASLQKKKVAGASTVRTAPGSSHNAYPWGWCTYYVATRRYVPGGWGNARSWLSSARRAGYATGSEPAAGAIVVLSESWMGHVAYVESVSGGRITISEMNYVGWGETSRRSISAHAGDVMGYVY